MASTSDKNDLVDFQDIKFGLEIRKLFCIGESLLYLNSGEHGITPKHLIQKKFDYYALMEKNTDLFVRHLQLDMFEDCKRVISKVLCCEAGSIVFNENSIESLNSILKSICNNSQGSIMIFDFLNESSKKICKYYSKYFNIELIEIATTKEDLNSTSQLISLVEEAISKKTPKLFVLEHIADNSLVLPVLNIVKLLKKSEVISVIDGSNSFGQISINLSEIDPGIFIISMTKSS